MDRVDDTLRQIDAEVVSAEANIAEARRLAEGAPEVDLTRPDARTAPAAR